MCELQGHGDPEQGEWMKQGAQSLSHMIRNTEGRDATFAEMDRPSTRGAWTVLDTDRGMCELQGHADSEHSHLDPPCFELESGKHGGWMVLSTLRVDVALNTESGCCFEH